jgi:pyruvate formate lyase activating enzyme
VKMLFGGLQKNSLIDYPGKVSCVLFLAGCNFDCPYCHNPDLVKGDNGVSSLVEADTVFGFLERRRRLLDGVVISGGEPTLQKDVAFLCGRIKGMGYDVKLDTNGSRPGVVRELIDQGLVDYVAMDIKADPTQYATFICGGCGPKSILETIRVIMASALPYEFRTTCVRPIVDAAAIEGIARLIRGAKRYILQQFNQTHVLHPEFFGNTKPDYDQEELGHIRARAAQWVEQCEIRAPSC